ncbi:MAG: response regulator [Saprospiraceae bacterium]|nr:response regulator [Saprospiraceae bacterium]
MERKFRAILIDDEPFCTAGLEIDLKETCPNIEIIAICNSAKEGMKQIKLLKPDVVFLDIEMPWMNGLELIEMLQPIDFEIIFITAYDEFAVKAFRLSAIDYLMKPVERSLLQEAVSRLEGKSPETDIQQQKVSQLFNNIKDPASSNPKITVPNRDGIDLIPILDIVYCKASSSYTEILLLDGTKKLVSRVLKDIGFQLESFNFLRVHQSYLINMEHLKSYHRSDGGYVEMINGDHITVSRSRKQELHSRLSL